VVNVHVKYNGHGTEMRHFKEHACLIIGHTVMNNTIFKTKVDSRSKST